MNPGANTPALPRHLQPESASKEKKRGGPRKSLKWLDSTKEKQGFNLDFVPPALESLPIRLGFHSEKFGFPSSARADSDHSVSYPQALK